MLYITSKLLAFLSKPIIWIFILIIFSIIFKKKRSKILKITLCAFYVFSNSFIADTLSRAWETPRSNPQEIYDVGIVLGGVSDYDKITETHNFNKHADRLMDAEQLYHQGIIKKIMLSGGNGTIINNGYTEADAMKKYLIQNHIPDEDILIENQSRNTRENAIKSSIILKDKVPNGKFLIITSAKHMKRAKLCFDQQNINTTVFATDCTTSYINLNIEYLLLPRIDALETWEDLIHEWIGYIVYKVTL